MNSLALLPRIRHGGVDLYVFRDAAEVLMKCKLIRPCRLMQGTGKKVHNHTKFMEFVTTSQFVNVAGVLRASPMWFAMRECEMHCAETIDEQRRRINRELEHVSLKERIGKTSAQLTDLENKHICKTLVSEKTHSECLRKRKLTGVGLTHEEHVVIAKRVRSMYILDKKLALFEIDNTNLAKTLKEAERERDELRVRVRDLEERVRLAEMRAGEKI